MTRYNSRIIGFMAVAGLVAGLTGCAAWKAKPLSEIIVQPKSRIVSAGEEVSFSVAVAHPQLVSYQWQFNGSDRRGATAATYTIGPADFGNVGEYRVVVRGQSGITVSRTAYLSVYSTTSLASGVNSGTLSTPIGQFGNPPANKCLAVPFQKGYPLVDPSGKELFFYGPKAAPQSGPFTNLGVGSTLIVDTFSSDNGNTATALNIKEQWVPYADVCNDVAPPGNVLNSGQTNLKQSQLSKPLSQNPGLPANKNTYLLTVYYNPPAPASGKVTFHWHYQ